MGTAATRLLTHAPFVPVFPTRNGSGRSAMPTLRIIISPNCSPVNAKRPLTSALAIGGPQSRRFCLIDSHKLRSHTKSALATLREFARVQ